MTMLTNSANCSNPDPRRQEIRTQGRNGIDFVEVGEDQRSIFVHFLGEAPTDLTAANVRIQGGRASRPVRVVEIRLCDTASQGPEDCLELGVDRPGDRSLYTLSISGDAGAPRDDLDPRYAQATFSFKANGATQLDCATTSVCPVAPVVEPEINYLAKDYASFRQIMLDRLALIMPEWTETHVPDLGIRLVELLAYVGDHLSYYQDAVATEAYLATARQRISVRRHARLVDYTMHEGCNARAWVCVETDQDQPIDLSEVFFIAADATFGGTFVLAPADLETLASDSYEVFEPMADAPTQLVAAHSRIRFYTWGEQECCLPRGATAATLYDSPIPTGPSKAPTPYALHLKPGDVLIFEEVLGPGTGIPADADPTHRHAVRLTGVIESEDQLYGVRVLQIEWSGVDALPFPVCIACTGPAPGCAYLEDVSIARGNVILVDHGRTWVEELEGAALMRGPLTFAEPLSVSLGLPAARVGVQNVRQALPAIKKLVGTRQGQTWEWAVRSDLLESTGSDRHAVVEIDNTGKAHLRFGDGDLGRMPAAGTAFTATYRVGNGLAGDVGGGAISLLVARSAAPMGITAVRNPLPAQGGTLAEPLADVKQYAPGAFRKQRQRAVTAADYAELALLHTQVEGAAAGMRWLGSWYEVLVAIQPVGTDVLNRALLDDVERFLQTYRRIGHEIKVVQAEYIPLDLGLSVSVKPTYLRGDVQAALLERFSNRLLAGGKSGYFFADNLHFGQDIALSNIVAAAQAVPGVASVDSLSVVARQAEYSWPAPARAAAPAHPVVPIGPLEIARVDNDPISPDNGVLALRLRGGR